MSRIPWLALHHFLELPQTGGVRPFGPRPSAGDPPHRYHFQVFALDTTLELPSGFNRNALLKAVQGHVLAEGVMVANFQKEP